jgi:hypothetical protein
MSSDEFASIFRNAVSIVTARCKDAPGLERALKELAARSQSDERNPLKNRRLIIEPVLDSQRFGVPLKTLECVATELHRLNILHLWARATCPRTDPEDDNVIIETDGAAAFRLAIAEPCPHCGQFHKDLPWSNIETFYAFHFDNHRDRFKLSRFLLDFERPNAEVPVRPQRPREGPALLRWVRGFFAYRARKPTRTPVDVVASTLALNEPTSRVPSNAEIALRFVVYQLGALALVILVGVACYNWLNVGSAILIGAIYLCVDLPMVWLFLSKLFAVSVLPRMLVGCGYLLALILFGGSLDWHLQWGDGVPLAFSAGSSEIKPVPAILGTILFAIVTAGIVALQWSQGWYTRR